MFQYRVEEKLFDGPTLKIFNGLIKATKEEIEITAIKRDCYKQNAHKMEMETYLRSQRDILIMIDAFPSTVFPADTEGEWLVVIETKKYLNLTDVILNNIQMDILRIIYEIISTMLTFSNCKCDEDCCYFYQRLIPQNIFISDSHDEIFLKFPFWLLSSVDMKKNDLNFSDSLRFYLPPPNFVPNADIWAFGCCLAEIFYGVPLFSSICESEQNSKMFEIVNALDQIINNEAIIDLIRCCFERPQISVQQLSVFLEMSKNESEQHHRLTFDEIRSWNNQTADYQNEVVLVGSASFISEWSLLPAEKKELDCDRKDKKIQTATVQTTDSCVNTGPQNENENAKSIMNISDCLKILPFNDPEHTICDKANHHNLLIIEFSKFCLIKLPQTEQNKLFSFECQMDATNKVFASPIFNINELQKTTQKIYIHSMCESISETLSTQLIAHGNEMRTKIGVMCIDISALRECKHIEGYFDILQSASSNQQKLGQIYVRVLPQFDISSTTNTDSCNQSVVTDDQSVASTEAWKMFNTFIVHKS